MALVRNTFKWMFFNSAAGKNLVVDELGKLPIEAATALADARRRYMDGTIRDREIENLKRGLYALRVTYDRCEYRLYFGIVKEHEVLLALHAIQKKGKRAPKKDVDRARDRLRKWPGPPTPPLGTGR